jgi:hypothetical protein
VGCDEIGARTSLATMATTRTMRSPAVTHGSLRQRPTTFECMMGGFAKASMRTIELFPELIAISFARRAIS